MRAGLSFYAEHRLAGPLKVRLTPGSWNLHMSVLSGFYKWAMAEGYAAALPFTYRVAVRLVDRVRVGVERNMEAAACDSQGSGTQTFQIVCAP